MFRTIFEKLSNFSNSTAHMFRMKTLKSFIMEHVAKKIKLTEEPADDQRCQYWVQRKKRFCKMTVGRYFN